MNKALLFLTAATACVVAMDVRDANACGGCFSPPAERTVVTDHRMVMSVSTNQTVLWDQIRYSGDPTEFAWVLPVKQGATIELANDQFFGALDASTQPVTTGPNTYGGGFGCGLTGCGEASNSSADSESRAGTVQVVSQSVIGPYETVTLRATEEDALTKWLTAHSYAIPPNIEPTIKAYVTEKFDFIALRLRPQCGERAMRPVRVISQGADPTLPLRMVAAGTGAHVGITLWVISEGRFEPKNFASDVINEDRLRWDRTQSRSNYEDLSQEIMGRANGRTWHIEYANNAELQLGVWQPYYYGYGGGSTPLLADAFFQQCSPAPAYGNGYYGTSPYASASASATGSSIPFTPCPQGTTTPPSDPNDSGAHPPITGTFEDAGTGQSPDAGDAGADVDASIGDGEDHGDAGAPPPPPPPAIDAGSSGQQTGTDDSDAGSDGETAPKSGRDVIAPESCVQFDDLDVALYGLHRKDVWVTRMRAVLPADALSEGDLSLQASAKQTTVSNLHYASIYSDQDAPASGAGGCGSAPKEHRSYGSWVLAFLSAVLGVAIIRRKQRK